MDTLASITEQVKKQEKGFLDKSLRDTIEQAIGAASFSFLENSGIAQNDLQSTAMVLKEAMCLISNHHAPEALTKNLASWLGMHENLPILNAALQIKGETGEAFFEELLEAFLKEGNHRATEAILKSGSKPRPDSVNIAVWGGSLQCVELLCKYGADIGQAEYLRQATDYRAPPLQTAFKKNDLEMARHLLKLNVDPNYRVSLFTDSWSALQYSALNGVSMTRLLLGCGAQPGNPPALHFAAIVGGIDSADILLNAGENINALRAELTALTAACMAGQMGMANFLIERGALIEPAQPAGEPEFRPRITPLQAAIRSTGLDDVDTEASLDLISVLLEKGANVNALATTPDFYTCDLPFKNEVIEFHGRRTALQLAVESGHKKLVQLLLDAGAKVNDHVDVSALDCAVRRGDREMIELLLRKGAEFMRDHDGYSRTLVEAARSGQTDLVARFLEVGVDANSILDKGNGHPIRRTSLFFAALNTDLVTFNTLISYGAALNSPHYQSVLTGAVFSNDIHMVRICIRLGANLYDPAALFMAVCKFNVDVQETLMETVIQKMGVDRRHGRSSSRICNNGKAALNAAIYKNNLHVVSRLVKAGTGLEGLCSAWQKKYDRRLPTHQDDEGNVQALRWPIDPALFAAVESGKVEIVRLLLEEGANVNARIVLGSYIEGPTYACQHQDTALQKACFTNKEIVKLLIDYRADVNSPAKGKLGRTALQAAAQHGDSTIVQLLLDHGADVNAPPAKDRGATALQLAAITGNISLGLLLLERGADVNAPGALHDGRTALEGAVERGRIDMVQLLFNTGARLDLPNPDHCERVFRLAAKWGHYAVIALLKSRLKEWNALVTTPMKVPERLEELADEWDPDSGVYACDSYESEDNEGYTETDSEGSEDI